MATQGSLASQYSAAPISIIQEIVLAYRNPNIYYTGDGSNKLENIYESINQKGT